MLLLSPRRSRLTVSKRTSIDYRVRMISLFTLVFGFNQADESLSLKIENSSVLPGVRHVCVQGKCSIQPLLTHRRVKSDQLVLTNHCGLKNPFDSICRCNRRRWFLGKGLKIIWLNKWRREKEKLGKCSLITSDGSHQRRSFFRWNH